MKKNIMIINADREAARIVKDNLVCPSTNIFCASSIHEALLSFMDKEFCLVILDACISAEDDHKLLKAMRMARTMPILILSSQSCHVERLKVLQAGAHAYIGHPYSLEGMSCPGTGAYAALLRPQTPKGSLLYAGFW